MAPKLCWLLLACLLATSLSQDYSLYNPTSSYSSSSSYGSSYQGSYSTTPAVNITPTSVPTSTYSSSQYSYDQSLDPGYGVSVQTLDPGFGVPIQQLDPGFGFMSYSDDGGMNSQYADYSQYSSTASSTPSITSTSYYSSTASPVIQTQTQTSQTVQTTPTVTTVTTSIPLPTPVISDSSNSAFGQITLDQSGYTRTQMYAPNCAEYVNGVCTKCSFRFVRGSDGSCEPVNPLCATWDTKGACLTCYPGYQICENGCIMTESCAPSGTYDPNCRNTVNGICQQCSVGYYFNQNGICTEVSPFCRTYDNNGRCLSCYAGYGLNAGSCVVLPDPVNNNPQCSKWVDGVCQSCSSFSWFNAGRCIPFDPMCSRSDATNGRCLGCYIGYVLSSGRCILSPNTQPNDLLCRRWNAAGVCVECSGNAFFRQNMCVAADPLCRTFDIQTGLCLSCYAGYGLTSGRCVVIPPGDVTNNNRYCSLWDGTVCRQCAKNTYFNANRICVPNNPLCATSNDQGLCLSCYNGYVLQNNNCVIDNSTINVGNALCSRWSGRNCQQCATRSYNRGGVCTAVNTLCRTWDNSNGYCLSCYNGYILNGNTCIINNNVVNNNPLCKTFNGGVCVECAYRAYFVNGFCTAIDSNCATFNSQNGICLSCYGGFALQGGRCIQLPPPAAPSGTTDIYCSKTDNANRCIRCFYGFALQNGVCVADFKNTPCGRDPKFCSK